MAGIGFELKKAVRDKSLVKKTSGYFGAAFSSSGSMIIGIIIFCVIQLAAGAMGVEEKTKDTFMCYVTNTMFFSMICASAINLALSRYVSDRIYLGENRKIVPSLVGSVSLVSFTGGLIFAVLSLISGVSSEETIMLFLLFQSLSCCWILMNYISILRDYKKIIRAYLSGFVIAAAALAVFVALNALSIICMIFVLLVSFVTVDVILFKAVYKHYTLADNSVLDFLDGLKSNPFLILNGFFLTLGTLVHFYITWFCSDLGESVNFLFRYSSKYDFPVIVAYFCTIPASIYFITLFETDFSKKYKDYFTTLGKTGNTETLIKKRGEMFASVEKGIANICKIQIITCLLFITLGGQLLYVMNIGMTEQMLSNFRIFCAGYSVYYIGYTVMLIHLYFMNEKRIFKSVALFLICVITSSVLFSLFSINLAGFGFFASAALFTGIVTVQLYKYMNKLEYNVLCGQPVRAFKRKSVILSLSDRLSSKFREVYQTPFRVNFKTVVSFALTLVILVASTTSLAINAYIESRTLRFYPEYSNAIERSPRMGLAPWAENKETKSLNTSLVYVELKWSDWEPEEGVYNVEYVYDHFNLNFYKADKRQVVFRFICDEPTPQKHIDIPDWLYKLTGGDGDYYHNSYGYGYSPNYKNKDIINCHTRAIRALGKIFGHDSFFTYVELGSLGHWGEWHTDYEHGVSHMPSFKTRKQYINPYIKAFPKAQFLIRYPLIDAKEYGFGLYNDLTGDYNETMYWLEQMNGGTWEMTGLKEQLNDKTIWETRPIGGEFTSMESDRKLMVEKFSTTLEAIKMTHQSFIGPKIIIDEGTGHYNDSMEKILRTIGYRFTVTDASVNLYDSDKVDINVSLTNKGIAPVYQDYYLNIELYDSYNNKVWAKKTDYNLNKLLPKESKTITSKINRDALDDDETYSLRVFISDKKNKNRLPMALKNIVKNSEYTYKIAEFNTN